ncbi:MAG: phage tail protein [Sphingomonas sp.]|nr:phage tail protein [Sphingomonas sp.]
MYLAALGLFIFEFASWPFDELSRRSDWGHASAARTGARDALQFTGPGDESVSIGGKLAPEVAGSFGAIDILRAMADEGDEYQFVLGTGDVWGGYVIVGLDERRKYMLVDGTPRLIDFTVDLKRAS